MITSTKRIRSKEVLSRKLGLLTITITEFSHTHESIGLKDIQGYTVWVFNPDISFSGHTETLSSALEIYNSPINDEIKDGAA